MTRLPCNSRLSFAFVVAAPLASLCGCGESLHDTVHRRDVGLAQTILARDPSAVNARNRLGKTPLHYAVTCGQPDFIDLFMACGADVAATDKTGLTPMHVAAILGRVEEAERLMAFKSPIEARDRYGDTPLHLAAIFDRPGMVAFLHKAGADVTARNGTGRTPLECARVYRRAETVAALETWESEDD
ncbi:MAG: ankyrin repeat domain-containing protein [Candidatus Hydrogenedentes bacterium]|nr:ankyrin repeat domain-containing protein [Candidatus Hydrogenedentota bacterium]